MKKYFYFLLIVLFLSPLVSSAQVYITEVFYSPTSKQWVEIYNDTDGDIDLTQYKILDSGAAVNGHGISAYESSGTTLPAKSYAVVAKIPGDFSVSNLFKSSLGIKASGDKVILRLGSGDVDSVEIYEGAATDGNSLQKNSSGQWIAATPTPGLANNESSGEVLGASTQSSSSSSGSSGSSGSSVSVTSSGTGQLEVSAGTDRLTTPGSPIVFQATVKKNTVQNQRLQFSWSFGDGYVGEGERVSHTYRHPGDYVVVLSAKAGEVFSVSRLKVKVLETSIALSETDEYIEITNNSASEINIFKWKLVSRSQGFIFQPDTIILPKAKIRIDRTLLSMKSQTEQGTVLLNSADEVVAGLQLTPSTEGLQSVSEQVRAIERQAYSIVNTAIDNHLVTETSPSSQYSDTDKGLTDVIFEAPLEAPEGQGEILAEQTGDAAEEVIYEAPKPEGFFSRLTNFIKRLFSR